jgi:hypothetical protein
LGHALRWSGRWPEAHIEQVALGDLACTDAQRTQAAILQVIGLAYIFGRPAEAETVLDAIASTISDDAAALELAGMRSALDANLGRTIQAARRPPGCSPIRTAPRPQRSGPGGVSR